jgi:hypothetical protein
MPITVRVGGIVSNGYVYNDQITTSAPAHAAGTVDVVVTNPDGQMAVLSGGYTYASPDSFEANGHWEGGADSNYETPLQFTVENNALVSVSCGASGLVVLSTPASLSAGAFSFAANGASMTGRLVAPDDAQGMITLPPCVAYPWYARRH